MLFPCLTTIAFASLGVSSFYTCDPSLTKIKVHLEELFAKVENNTNIARIRPEYSCLVEVSLRSRIERLQEQDNVIYFLVNGSRILEHLLTSIGTRHLKYYLGSTDQYGCVKVVNRTPYSDYVACLFV